jgi:hypothetical protein
MKEQIEDMALDSINNFMMTVLADQQHRQMLLDCIYQLVERLDKAIGIDEEKINSELLARYEWFYKFQEGNVSGGWLRHKIAKSIKELRPLKVTVENE